jgi:MFS transporter, FHS family, glucose/mannose:H+ symporter
MTISHRSWRDPRLLVLYPVFALTGVADVITGPMLPSLARTFNLSDSQSGNLLFLIFAGMATGALLCRGFYLQILKFGLLALTLECVGFMWISGTFLFPFSFLFGVSVGAPMTAISLFVGRNFPARRAATLTLLNFMWSLGAAFAPLLAARLLAVSSWRAVYGVLACAALLAMLAVQFMVRDSGEAESPVAGISISSNLRLISLFAAFFFLEVGIESMYGAWISTYALRSARTTIPLAAAAVSFYWLGYLASRGLSPVILLRARSRFVLGVALLGAFGSAAVLLIVSQPWLQVAAVLLLGASLAPVFPVALAVFFDRARQSSDSRFILALSGFGGSVFPWIVGWLSALSGSLRFALAIGPVTQLAMIAMLPVLISSRPAPAPAISLRTDGPKPA